MSDTSYIAEEKELAIDTPEGLRSFLNYARDAFEELEAAVKLLPSSQLGVPFLTEAQRIFSSLEALVDQYMRILDLGGYLAEEHTNTMQDLYNELLTLEEELVAAMEYVPSSEPLTEKHVYGEKEDVMPTHKRGVVSIDSDTEDNPIKLSITEHHFDSEEIRTHAKVLKRRGDAVLQEATALLDEFKALSEVDDPAYADGTLLYKNFENDCLHLRQQLSRLEQLSTSVVSVDTKVLLDEVENIVNDFPEIIAKVSVQLADYFADDVEDIDVPVTPLIEESATSVSATVRPSLFTKNELRPFIEAALRAPGNMTFLANYFSSPGAFEAYLKRDIDEREKPSKFEKVFGITHQSPFHTLLRDLTLAEIEHLEQLPSVEIRAIVNELDIQYELYVAWMDAYTVMKEYVQPLPSIPFGEFYARAMIEDLKARYGA